MKQAEFSSRLLRCKISVAITCVPSHNVYRPNYAMNIEHNLAHNERLAEKVRSQI